MPSLKDLKNRIESVKSTRKITKAMQMVAAAKLRRAQEAALSGRSYSDRFEVVMSGLASSVGSNAGPRLLSGTGSNQNHLLIVMTAERGLCGGFNSSILKRAELFLKENADRFESIEVATLGRRGADHFRKRDVTLHDNPGIFDGMNFRSASDLADEFSRKFLSGDYDHVYLLYNHFKSAINQVVTLDELLPVAPETSGDTADYIYEPGAVEVLESLVPRYVAILVWRAMLESQASEHGARMSAMDSATKNAVEICDKLTLEYNRARQAAITQELMEIVSGAEALK